MSGTQSIAHARGFFIGPVERRSFIWEHRPERATALAIVICTPLGYQYTCAYRTLRRLAERLASLGHVVVRLEYHGTSNAAGGHLEANLVDAWRACVADAISHVAAHGALQVGLVGLGFGALLAMQQASKDTIASHLVLWDPVTSGRRFARELTALAMATGEAQPTEDDAAALSVVGIRYTSQTLDDMKQLDAAQYTVADRSVLLIERPEREPLDEFVGALQESHCEVTRRRLSGTSELLDTDAELARFPAAIVDEIVRWIAAARIDSTPITNETRSAVDAAPARLEAAGCDEEYERIEPTGLAVVWGRNPRHTDPTCVIFLNNGVAPSTGPARAWVEMSRALNRHGWGTMRLDVSGLGESPTRPRFHDDDNHARVVTDDISEAIDAAKSRGYTQFILVGLCSGAFNAIEAQYADDRVTSFFALNPAVWVTPRRWKCWLAPWWRLFEFGMRKTPIRVRVLRLPRWLWRTLAFVRITPPADLTLRHLARLGRRSTIVFSDDDAGFVDFERRTMRAIDEYQAPASTVEVVVVGNLDHSLFGHGARETVTELLLDWMEQWRLDSASLPPADGVERRENFGK
jgi:alpha/beta superfamily hydrolase